MLFVIYLVIPGLATLAFCLVGAGRPRLRDPAALAALAAACLAAIALAAAQHDPDVGVRDFLEGMAISALLIGGVPAIAYLLLGRALSRHRTALVVVWALSIAPLGVYLLLVELLVAALVACPPDAYECPV